jgi:hypothetical protein
MTEDRADKWSFTVDHVVTTDECAAQRFADLSIQERRLEKHPRKSYHLPAVHRSLRHSTVPLICEERSNTAIFLSGFHINARIDDVTEPPTRADRY